MRRLVVAAATSLLLGSFTLVGYAQSEVMNKAPSDGKTVTDWYKQSVYDPTDKKIGEIMDVLVSPSGQVSALIVGVGGFIGAGEKDVAVSFNTVKPTTKNNKTYLVMNSSKDELKAAPGLKYDRNKTAWVPDESNKNK